MTQTSSQSQTIVPRVSAQDVAQAIIAEHYFSALDGVIGHEFANRRDSTLVNIAHAMTLSMITVCVLVLDNGFSVMGQSTCADSSHYDAELGRQAARENAVRGVWELLCFRRRDAVSGFSATDMANQGSDQYRAGYAAHERGDAPPLAKG